MTKFSFLLFIVSCFVLNADAIGAPRKRAATRPAPTPVPVAPSPFSSGAQASFGTSGSFDAPAAGTTTRYKLGSLRYFPPLENYVFGVEYATPLSKTYSYKNRTGTVTSKDEVSEHWLNFSGEYGLKPDFALGLSFNYLLRQRTEHQNLNPNRTTIASASGLSDPTFIARYRFLPMGEKLNGATGDAAFSLRPPLQKNKLAETERRGSNPNTGAWDANAEAKLVWLRGQSAYGGRLNLGLVGTQKVYHLDEAQNMTFDSYFHAELEGLYAYHPNREWIVRPLLTLVLGHDHVGTVDASDPVVTVTTEIPVHLVYGFEVDYEPIPHRNFYAKVEGQGYDGTITTQRGTGTGSGTPYEFSEWLLTLGFKAELD